VVFLVVLVATTGCSYMIAISGHPYPLGVVQEGATRAEMHDQLGTPAGSGICPDGRPFERYRIRRTMEGFRRMYDPPGDLRSVLLEPLLTPIAAIASEVRRVPVTVVYGPDERVLYRFPDREEARIRFNEAKSGLTSAWSPNSMEALSVLVSAYVDEFRRRAACVEYTLSAADEATLDYMNLVAQEGTWGIATREEALNKLSDLARKSR
jgi:hypothetical protein